MPPGGKKKNRPPLYEPIVEKRALTIQLSDDSEAEYDNEEDYVDYSLSPFVNMSTIKRQAKYGFKHATLRANSINEELAFP